MNSPGCGGSAGAAIGGGDDGRLRSGGGGECGITDGLAAAFAIGAALAGPNEESGVSPSLPKMAVKPPGSGGAGAGSGRADAFDSTARGALSGSMICVGESSASLGEAGAYDRSPEVPELAAVSSIFPKKLVNSPADRCGAASGRFGVSGVAAVIRDEAGKSVFLNARVKSPAFGRAGDATLAGGATLLTESSQVVKSANEVRKSVTATGDPSTSAISRSFLRAGSCSASSRARVVDRCSGVSESR